MNVNSFLTKAYENQAPLQIPENKPNQTQFQDGQICNYYDPGLGNEFDPAGPQAQADADIDYVDDEDLRMLTKENLTRLLETGS